MEPLIDWEVTVDKKTGLMEMETRKARYLTLNYSHLAIIAAAVIFGAVIGGALTHWIGL